MSVNSDFSYIHMEHPSYIVYIQEWSRDALPFDDVEIEERYLNSLHHSNVIDSNGGGNTLQSTAFGSSINSRANQRRFRESAWKDLDLKKFLLENHSSHKNTTVDDDVDELEETNHSNNIGSDRLTALGEPLDNSIGGIRVMNHDHTILETVQWRNNIYSNVLGSSTSRFPASASLNESTSLSIDTSLNTTGTTTSSLAHSTNRLTMSDSNTQSHETQQQATLQSQRSPQNSVYHPPTPYNNRRFARSGNVNNSDIFNTP